MAPNQLRHSFRTEIASTLLYIYCTVVKHGESPDIISVIKYKDLQKFLLLAIAMADFF